MSRANYDRAATMACRCLLACGVTTLPVDSTAMLRRCRDTRLASMAQVAEMLKMTEHEMGAQFRDADACTFSYTMEDGHEYRLVCYKEGGNPGRLNFSLAHELGHIVLKHSNAGEWEEREADHFAMHLLCPRPVMRMLAARQELLYAEQIAALCYVSVSVAENLERCRRSCVEPDVEAQLAQQMKNALPEKLPENRMSAYWRPVSIACYIAAK